MAEPAIAIRRGRQVVAVEAPEVEGYEPVSATVLVDGEAVGESDGAGPVELELVPGSDRVVRFAYAGLAPYTVRYVGPEGEEVADAKMVDGHSPGETVTESAPDIEGYRLTSDKEVSLVLSAGGNNEIVFEYEPDWMGYGEYYGDGDYFE